MKVRRIVLSEDYPILKTWWERRGSDAPPETILPEIGVVSELGDQMIACAFLYQDTGRKCAIVEWEATNPDCHSLVAVMRGLNMVFDFWETYCAGKGISCVLSWVKSGRGDGRLLTRRGWVKCPGERHEMMAYVPKGAQTPCR